MVRTLAGDGTRGETNAATALTSCFAMPTGLIVDPDTNHVYVCDYGNHIIRKVHSRVVVALKQQMSKEEGRFPPMPVIIEEAESAAAGEDDKDDDNTDPVSTNSQSGTESTNGADGKPKKSKKGSKSKKREKTENGVEGGDSKTEDGKEGSSSAKGSVTGASDSGAAGSAPGGPKPPEGEDASKKDDDKRKYPLPAPLPAHRCDGCAR